MMRKIMWLLVALSMLLLTACGGDSQFDAQQGTVTSPTGRVWMDKNLGATQVATAFDDSDAFGDLYQWGRGTDGHEKRTSDTTTTLSSSDTPGHGSFILVPNAPSDWRITENNNPWQGLDLWQGLDGVNNPCPSGFRLPTTAEWEAERATWSSNDRDGAFASPLKLVSAGSRNGHDGAIYDAGSEGAYWSSSVYGSAANYLLFYGGYAYMDNYFRADGYSVRCIQDDSKVVHYTVTATAGTGGSVSPGSRIVSNDSTTSFTVTPNSGYSRNGTVGGTCPAGNWSGNDYTTGVITDNCSVSFSFHQTQHTVTSLTGRVWMDRNLGASRVATAYNDSAAYGDLYQWGRGTDGHEKRTSDTTTTLSSSDSPGHGSFILGPNYPWEWRSPENNNLWQGVSGVNNPCPSGFRLPTTAEWEAERATWSSNDRDGAFASPLKLVSAGSRSGHDGAIYGAGSDGVYWSSSVYGLYPRYAYFYGDYAYAGSDSHAGGLSLRCIQDDSTVVYSTVTSLTGRVWMDRNLGASRVATAYNDPDAYGDLYQWGRGTDGHEKRTSDTTTTLSSSDSPGHGSFITGSTDWLNYTDNNLWQGVSGVNNPCPSGFRLPTTAEWEAERATWLSNDRDGAFASPLKLVQAGYRIDAFYSAGSSGEYWSSSEFGFHAYSVYFYYNDAYPQSNFRAYGFSVRCLED